MEGATFNGASHLTYPTYVSIAMAYSSVKWTERIREYVLENADVRQRRMRSVDLIAAINTVGDCASLAPHAGPITQLGEQVADITPNGAVDGFTSTTVSTAEREEAAGSDGGDEEESLYPLLAVKPEITHDSVLENVTKHDEAIFVALDDDLGIVNDLIFTLLGRQLELEAFLDEHGHRLETALITQTLCGLDESGMPDQVRQDPVKLRHARELIQQRLEAMRLQEVAATMNRSANIGRPDPVVELQYEAQLSTIDAELEALGIDPPNSDDLEALEKKSRWIHDVRYQEAVGYINAYQPQLERLQSHVKVSLDDTLTWLDRLPAEGGAVCYDPCEQQQSRELLEFAFLVSQAVGATETGREWLTKTFLERDTLIGTSLLNFTPALGTAFDAIAHEWSEGNAPGEEDGGISIGRATDIGNVVGNLKSVLDLESVQQSALYQQLSRPIKDSFEVMQVVVAGTGKAVWETLAYQALPATGAGAQVGAQAVVRGITNAMLVAFIHPDNLNVNSRLVRTEDFEARHRRWRADIIRRENRLRGQQDALARPATRQARASQLRDISAQQKALDDLGTKEPKRFMAYQGAGAAGGLTETLGFDELREQNRLRTEQVAGGVAAARQRMTRWMDSRGIGGLPLLVAVLNLLNVSDSILTAQKEGVSQADMEKIASQAGYATAAVLSLWVMPYWQRYANRTASFGTSTLKITQAGSQRWLNVAGNTEVSRLAGRMANRVAGMAAFAAIGAGIETWQIAQQYGKASGNDEQTALLAKGLTTTGMTIVGGTQLLGGLVGRWLAFSWILAPWASWALLALSVGYLISSMLADYYSRDGVRLWLYKSTWGNAKKWSDSDEDNTAELRALNEALFAPSLKLTPVVKTEFDMSRTMSQYSPGKRVSTLQGYWVQLALPATLAGEAISVSEQVAGGFWAPSASFQERPPQGEARELPGVCNYQADDPLRVWQAWLPAERLAAGEPFLMEVTYDEAIYSDTNGGLSFTFFKPEPSQGKRDVEVSEHYRGTDNSIKVPLTVPTV
ncbi:T6SS effector BTH_I2691 family protein [Vreelandella songnenensis]|uniref:T6SS effector BTH_I2691 family protein n=1 Tax=Vreelandella songnenensis TaxID=1176243 RepID=UPI00244AD6EA|nr:T6SS effector BTH_I2691 family protein [Halomonas songnenensis]